MNEKALTNDVPFVETDQSKVDLPTFRFRHVELVDDDFIELSLIEYVRKALNGQISKNEIGCFHIFISSEDKARTIFNRGLTEFVYVESGFVEINGRMFGTGCLVRIDPCELYVITSANGAKIRSLIYPNYSKLSHNIWECETDPNLDRIDVSIVIIAQNLENYICQAIHSCISQTHRYIEILVIDDNSTDSTFNKALSMSCFDNRIKVYLGKYGRNGARRAGIQRASGSYILVMDGDDWLNHNAIEQLLANAHKTASECIIFGFDHFDDASLVVSNPIYPLNPGLDVVPIYYARDAQNSKWAAEHNHTIWMIFFSRRLIHQAVQSLPDLNYYEDVPFLISLLSKAETNSICNYILYHYRRNRKGQSTEKWMAVSGDSKRLDLCSATRFALQILGSDDLFLSSVLYRKLEKIVFFEMSHSYLTKNFTDLADWIVCWITLGRMFPFGIKCYLDHGSQKRRFSLISRNRFLWLLNNKTMFTFSVTYARLRQKAFRSRFRILIKGVEKWV